MTALEQVDLRVERGEFVVVLGPGVKGKRSWLSIRKPLRSHPSPPSTHNRRSADGQQDRPEQLLPDQASVKQ